MRETQRRLQDRGPTQGILKKQLKDQFAVQLTENSKIQRQMGKPCVGV